MIINVLGVDLAVARWSSNGSARISFKQNADSSASEWLEVVPGVVVWPNGEITPANMVDALLHFIMKQEIHAVSLDGPQGWRNPATEPGLPGVGRRCEYEVGTQAKTGIYGQTFPGNQLPWVEFCIDVFDLMLARGAILVDSELLESLPLPPAGKFYLMECFPTSTWKSNQLPTFPGKRNNPPVNHYWQVLKTAFQLPGPEIIENHDDLQAVVGALPAAAALGANCGLRASGVPSMLIPANETTPNHRAEGLIWDAIMPGKGKKNLQLQEIISNPPLIPSKRPMPRKQRQEPPESGACQIRITKGVFDYVQRIIDHAGRGDGNAELMISIRGWEETFRGEIAFNLRGNIFTIYKNDTHACRHGSQQTDAQRADFESCVTILRNEPGRWVDVIRVG